MSAWNFCVGLGCVIAGVAGVFTGGYDFLGRNGADDEAYDELEGEISNEGEGDPDESTPLIQRTSQLRPNLPRRRRRVEAETLAGTWWWIPQFIISVPFPVILISHVAMIILDAMPPTLADGSPAILGQFEFLVIFWMILELFFLSLIYSIRTHSSFCAPTCFTSFTVYE